MWDIKDDDDDDDCVPACLLSATSLFTHYEFGPTDSYLEFLRDRAVFLSFRTTDVDPRTDMLNIESSGAIINIAVCLLRHLRLPFDTTVTYMLACGKVFHCLNCHYGSGTMTMTWPQLVHHFITQNKTFRDLCEKNIARNANVPIRNDHDLNSTDSIVSRSSTRTTVDMEPTGENAARYSALPVCWGDRIVYTSGLEVVEASPSRVIEDERALAGTISVLTCHLCKKLDVTHIEITVDLSVHMRNRHGTDLEGNLLSEDSAT